MKTAHKDNYFLWKLEPGTVSYDWRWKVYFFPLGGTQIGLWHASPSLKHMAFVKMAFIFPGVLEIREKHF